MPKFSAQRRFRLVGLRGRRPRVGTLYISVLVSWWEAQDLLESLNRCCSRMCRQPAAVLQQGWEQPRACVQWRRSAWPLRPYGTGPRRDGVGVGRGFCTCAHRRCGVVASGVLPTSRLSWQVMLAACMVCMRGILVCSTHQHLDPGRCDVALARPLAVACLVEAFRCGALWDQNPHACQCRAPVLVHTALLAYTCSRSSPSRAESVPRRVQHRRRVAGRDHAPRLKRDGFDLAAYPLIRCAKAEEAS